MSAQNQRRPIRVAFWTLGCRLNQYDTEGVRTALQDRYAVEVVPWDTAADVYVLNSCTVTGRADQECRRLARQVKRREPAARVVVAGCYAQTQPAKLATVAEIDGVVGNTAKEAVADWFPAVLAGGDTVVRRGDFAPDATFAAPLIDRFAGRSRAFVKVQDGCDLRCTYCAIWQARGPGRSRRAAEVLAQIERLSAAGHREFVLAGVHLGSYGRDRGEKGALVALLRDCVAAFPERRFRLSSIHPNEVTPELLGLLAENPALRPHLHVSLQSGADGVLRRMRRPYRAAAAREAVLRAARTVPDCGLGADIIVGFPGETDTEFAATRRLVEELPFTYLHVFRYSPRPGTVAAELTERVHPETVSERGAVLRKIAASKRREFARAQVGCWREAVLESPRNGGDRTATTDNYVTVLVPRAAGGAGELVRLRPRWRDGGLRARTVVPLNAATRRGDSDGEVVGS